MTLDGGEVRRVTTTEDQVTMVSIRWSPDGEIIAYVTGGKIWLAPRDGGEATSIETGLDARIGRIDWLPDGKTIAFIATTGGKRELLAAGGFPACNVTRSLIIPSVIWRRTGVSL